MNFRDYLKTFKERGELIVIDDPISSTLEIAAVMKQLEPKPVLFENVAESEFRVFGNMLCSKQRFADYFGIDLAGIIPLLSQAIEHPTDPEIVANGPCQEIVNFEPDLNKLPIPFHFQGDGGRFITSGVAITTHPDHGQNMDFHRCMQISTTEMSVRVVKGRHFDAYLEDLGQVEVAICVGNTPNVLVAGAISVEMGVDELGIANSLEPLQLVQAKTVDLMIPAEAEIVLEGIVYWDRRHTEGPFVDLTETQDVIRQEPVFEVKAITHRKDAIWQALLPGALEHKLLMGMPREPTILREVNKVAKCLDVNVNPGGCSWLHAIVQIEKQNEDDGVNTIHAAFAGHRSCKHVYVVDKDINIYDPLEVDWAMATRFQGDRDMVVLPREPGSSLDPSAEAGTKMTTKIGFDLTAPLGAERKPYEKVPYPEADMGIFVKED